MKPHPGQTGKAFAQHGHPLVEGEGAHLAGVAEDRDDHVVEQGGGPTYHVEVPDGHRIEASWAHAPAHGALIRHGP